MEFILGRETFIISRRCCFERIIIVEFSIQMINQITKKLRSIYYKEKYIYPYLFVLPALLFLIIIVFFPLLSLIILSFGELSFRAGAVKINFVGLSNYIDVLSDEMFWLITGHTLYFTGISVSVGFVIGLFIALVLNELKEKPGIVHGLILVPWMVPWVVSALIWKWVLHPQYGVLNDLLLKLGIISQPINWFSPSLAMGSVIAVDIWTFSPFVIIVLYSGLRQIPDEIFDATQIDGANYWQRFRYVSLPLLKPFIFVVLLIRTIFALRAYDKIYVLTNGGPGNATEVFATQIVKTGIGAFDFSHAAAISVIVLLLTLVVSIIYAKTLG